MRRLCLTLVVVVALVAIGCSGPDESPEPLTAPSPASLNDAPRQYVAQWLISAESVNADGPGFPFVYREVVDDRNGVYLVQSPDHLATQTPDRVVFCAAILRVVPFCAATERAEGTPHVLAYPIQLLRGWGPGSLYDLATHREIRLAVAREPDVWQVRQDTINGDIAVECFTIVGETSAASEGFEICYTDDDLHLVASVDLQSDFVYEIDLIAYSRSVTDEDLETGLDEFVEERATLQQQLIALYPEIPAPRPTPTPVLD